MDITDIYFICKTNGLIDAKVIVLKKKSKFVFCNFLPEENYMLNILAFLTIHSHYLYKCGIAFFLCRC